ncbi:type II toxin-antitoxin system RelE/ParE family toxin [Campylobacter troglodytis]|uniref:type II toxin-antitoxin system RelE/ParE family toxin n=1 Tax=Campylobacter troglodytis TaxID=654363 RepID=UPI00115A84C8|nr:type II toxin-antitoxin system RelE/ParE family toxin [Campylobacter troglodytis]TQR60748.1 plasmid maintenance system killer protein [Campylobacter troglodytis]
MIQGFKDKQTQEFYTSGKGKLVPSELCKRALIKLDALNASVSLNDLKSPPSNHLEKLQGDKKGFYSIRINKRYRIVFKFQDSNAYEVSVEDYH